ncbi:MAG: PAS domain S-box protein [Flavobacteriales bacterium]|nr:PAS domain S-box protein [Flavobacteriales bacterium]
MIKLDKLKRLIEIGCVPSDSPEERLRKSIMTIMVIPYSLAGIIWGLYFMRNGFAISGVIPLAYAVVSVTSFLYFIYTKRYNIFRFFQVFLVLVLPFFLQLTLGGFSQSSGMLLWSCTAPFIALVFYDVKTARKWFVALFFTLVLACFLDELARSYFSEDKEIKWISSSTRIIKSTDGTPFFMTGIAQDITAQKTAQEQLKQLNDNLEEKSNKLENSNLKLRQNISEMVTLRTKSEAVAQELRHFLETANAPIFGIDANGKVNEWNQTSEKITGFKKEEVFGKNLVKTYITEDYQKAVKLVLDNALKGEETANYEFPLFTKEGSRVMVLLNSSTRRNSDGEIVGVLGVGQDITIINEYKENLEKKVKHRTIELEESLEREKELGKLKSSFVSTASHQFRTPLAAIQANSELLSMLARDVEQQNQEKCIKITNRITVEIARMTELMDDVLLLGKSTSGSIDVKPQEINLVDFCQTLAKRFNDIQTDGRIINVATEGEPYNVYLDFKLLSQALSNLLSNAFKFSLGKSNPTLTVSFKPKGFSLIVEDYGIGIPKAEIANLFHPFFRANNATEIKGTGLGLSIAKEYIELNKGILTGKSTEGIGTKFEISFKKYVLREKYGN